jgi:uncharacterized protein YaiE (UPF0345 family)
MQVVDSSGFIKVRLSGASDGLTVGTTPIASGTIGRVLFQGTGNVLQQSTNLFWDNTGFLGIGTSTPFAPLGYNGITINSTTGAFIWIQSSGVTKYSIGTEGNINYHNLIAGTSFLIRSGGLSYFNVVQSTGNVQINTTTDAGFKLDVNGTARVSMGASAEFRLGISAALPAMLYASGATSYMMRWKNDGSEVYLQGGTFAVLKNSTQEFILQNNFTYLSAGNLGIGTGTNAGFKLDVNGTARVSNVLSVGTDTATINLYRSSGSDAGRLGTGYINPAINHVYFTANVNQKALLIDETSRSVFSSGFTATIASAQVAIVSTVRGFLPPVMTTTQKNAIATPAAGLVVFDSTLNKLCVYTTAWETVTSL